jgi:hypothetical protein
MLLGLIITLALIAGFVYYVRHKADRRNPPRKAKAVKHSQFHCVETHHHPKCCEAVKALHGKRFLSAEAPSLPVKGCNQAHCDCDYIHHDDRRVEIRRTDIGIQHDMYGQSGEEEKREIKRLGRRVND